jgi:KAP family P-loop domain
MSTDELENKARHRVDQLLDRPIETSEADLLGFRQVAESLVDAICAQPNGNSLTLGLDGAWGSGKSSILALLRETLSDAPKGDGIGTVVVSFSPWLITNRTALVAAFFAQLSTAIEQAEKRIPKDWSFFKKSAGNALSSARKQLNRFSKIASIVSTSASAFDPTLVSAAAAGSMKAVEKLTDDGGKAGKTLETLKQELTTALSKIATADPSFRILVLIDDLDRLDPGDALEVLRLVKAVGDFPATTYLLAYDRSAIARAIEHSAKIENGAMYLEKIIQFSFKVPPLEPFQLRNWLKSELEKLFPDTINHALPRATAVLDSWAGRLISTPRDVKRLLFAIRAIWPKLEGRADLLDLIWLQMLAQKGSQDGRDLYSWVVGYLQGLEAVAIGGTVTGRDEEQKTLTRNLKDLGWKEYEHGIAGASIDFHHLDELLAGITANHLSANDADWTYKITDAILQKYRDEKRLSSPWHWRLYFALDVPSHAVTDDEWQALVQAAARSTAELASALGTVLEFRSTQRRDTADQIIGRASHAVSNGSLYHAGRWIAAIAQQAEAMEERSKKDALFGFTKLFDINLKAFARLVFKSISGSEREDALTAIFKQRNTLCPAANLIRDQYHAAKKEGYERGEKFYLSDVEFADLVADQVALYEALTPLDFRALPGPYDVLYAWKDIAESKEGPAKLLTEAFKEDSEFLETLSALRYVSSSAQNGVARIPEEFLKHFVDAKATKERLRSLAHGSGEHSAKASELLDLWWGPEE